MVYIKDSYVYNLKSLRHELSSLSLLWYDRKLTNFNLVDELSFNNILLQLRETMMFCFDIRDVYNTCSNFMDPCQVGTQFFCCKCSLVFFRPNFSMILWMTL